MLSAKRLQTILGKLEPFSKEVLSIRFNRLWEDYHKETEYYKTLWANGKIPKSEYDKVAIPKLRAIRDELYQTARVLQAI